MQQNAFDEVDEATIEERQRYVFHVIYGILETEFDFGNKDDARRFFLGLRQKFIEWNSIEFKTGEFLKKEKEIEEEVSKHAKNI